jgi:hypothetical protein
VKFVLVAILAGAAPRFRRENDDRFTKEKPSFSLPEQTGEKTVMQIS